jgi:hypothetical protein
LFSSGKTPDRERRSDEPLTHRLLSRAVMMRRAAG